jgi:hypothetical protein
VAYETVETEITVPEHVSTRKVVVARVCDKCGLRDEKEPEDHYFDDPYWIPIEVHAGEAGEEGWDVAERVFCADCAPEILGALQNLGFATHYHGGTSLLQDETCPGDKMDGVCPTPSSPYEDDGF